MNPLGMTTSPTGSAIPRRWSVEVDGIRWLPRMIDKARMSASGALGTYLMGHSPVDKALLDRLGITTAAFVDIVRTASDDASVLGALRKRGFDEMRVRRWSDRFPATYKTYILLWDLDEGYRTPTALQRLAITMFRPLEAGAMALVRALRRAP